MKISMNRKILISGIITLSSSFLCPAASAPTNPDIIHIGTYTVKDNMLSITSPDSPHILHVNLTQNLMGEEKSIGAAMTNTHAQGFDFCFSVCKISSNSYGALRTDSKLFAFANPPLPYTRLDSYMIPPPSQVTGPNLQIFSSKFLNEHQLPREFTPLHPLCLKYEPKPAVVYVPVPHYVERTVPVPIPVLPQQIIVNGTLLSLQRPGPSSNQSKPLTPSHRHARSHSAASYPLSAGTSPLSISNTLQKKVQAMPETPLPSPLEEPLQTLTLQETEKAGAAALTHEQTRLKEEEQKRRETEEALKAQQAEEARQLLEQQQQDQKEQARRVAEAAAAQEVRAREEEKIRAKAEKEKARLQQREQEEQMRREAKKQQEEARAEQARKDKEAAKAQKEKKQQEEREAKTAANRESKKKKKPEKTTRDLATRLHASAHSNDDDKILEAAKKANETARLAQATALLATPPVTVAAQAGAAAFRPVSPEENPLEVIEEIKAWIKATQYAEAKALLPKIQESKPIEHCALLVDIYTKAPSLLSDQELESTMQQAKRYVKNEAKKMPAVRSILYFGLALSASSYEEKETYLDQCLSISDHLKAKAYLERIKLEEHDRRNLQCPKKTNCAHAQALTAITTLREDPRYGGRLFADSIISLLKLYRGDYPQIKALVPTPERKRYIANLYERNVRTIQLTRAELDEIHSLIPEDIIPADQRITL